MSIRALRADLRTHLITLLSTSRRKTLKQLPVKGVELEAPSISTVWLAANVLRPRRRAEDVACGRLELGFGLACASQRCNHVLNRHAPAIVRIDKARLDPFILAHDKGSRDGKHPGGITLIIRDVPTGR
jgi:hypothetical protein